MEIEPLKGGNSRRGPLYLHIRTIKGHFDNSRMQVIGKVLILDEI